MLSYDAAAAGEQGTLSARSLSPNDLGRPVVESVRLVRIACLGIALSGSRGGSRLKGCR